ncbi:MULTISPECIES: hypothetical protein [unclassified Streptomyces]|uniref:hypothetical protein n=1 Tax=unclassified Streptomyces TaxID=2593676 RepID=UPI00403CF089
MDDMLWVTTASIRAATVVMPIYGNVSDRVVVIEAMKMEQPLNIHKAFQPSVLGRSQDGGRGR